LLQPSAGVQAAQADGQVSLPNGASVTEQPQEALQSTPPAQAA
jgi:hypothetical protein